MEENTKDKVVVAIKKAKVSYYEMNDVWGECTEVYTLPSCEYRGVDFYGSPVEKIIDAVISFNNEVYYYENERGTTINEFLRDYFPNATKNKRNFAKLKRLTQEYDETEGTGTYLNFKEAQIICEIMNMEIGGLWEAKEICGYGQGDYAIVVWDVSHRHVPQK